jgi:hypothetical protein
MLSSDSSRTGVRERNVWKTYEKEAIEEYQAYVESRSGGVLGQGFGGIGRGGETKLLGAKAHLRRGGPGGILGSVQAPERFMKAIIAILAPLTIGAGSLQAQQATS